LSQEAAAEIEAKRVEQQLQLQQMRAQEAREEVRRAVKRRKFEAQAAKPLNAQSHVSSSSSGNSTARQLF